MPVRRSPDPVISTPADGTSGVAAVLDAMRQFDLMMESARAAFANRHQITVNDSLVMTTLLLTGRPMKPSELATRLSFVSGTMTTMLDRLEAARLVERVPNRTDRRSVLVRLTESGRQALQKGVEQLERVISSAVAPQQRDRFAESLTHLALGLGELARGPQAAPG